MKIFILICLFFCLNFVAQSQILTKDSICSEKYWIQFLDNCYDSTTKENIKKSSIESYTLDRSYNICEIILKGYILKSDFCIGKTYAKLLNYKLLDYIRMNYYAHLTNSNKINIKEKLDSIIKDYDKYFAKVEENLTKDSINGIYIPKDIEDALLELTKLETKTNLQAQNLANEEDFVNFNHLNTGLYLRNIWNLWGGSRLSVFFENLGIYHPDTISAIILHEYYRKINHLNSNFEYYIKYYQSLENR